MTNILAEPEDLFLRLGIDDPSPQMRSRAERLLDDVADQVLRFTRQDFVMTVNDSVVVDGSGSSVLFLPQLPVISVTSVAEDGIEVDPSTWEWSEDGRIIRLSGCWLRRLRYYTVVYSHGFASIPPAVQGIVLRVAARGWVNPTGLTQEAAGGWSGGYGFDASRFPLLAQPDMDELREGWMAR